MVVTVVYQLLSEYLVASTIRCEAYSLKLGESSLIGRGPSADSRTPSLERGIDSKNVAVVSEQGKARCFRDDDKQRSYAYQR